MERKIIGKLSLYDKIPENNRKYYLSLMFLDIFIHELYADR